MRRQILRAWSIAGLIAVITACSVSAVEQSPTMPVDTGEAVPATAENTDIESTLAAHGAETPDDREVPVEPTAVPSELETPSPSAPDTSAAAAPPNSQTAPPLQTSASPTPDSSTSNTATSDSQVSSMFGPITCRTGEENVELSELMYEPEMFDILVPMGRMWDSHVTPTDHMYFFSKEGQDVGLVKTPAAGRLLSVGSFPRTQSPPWDPTVTSPDLRVVIAHSCTLFSVFIHVGELVPEIAVVVGEIEQGGNWYSNPDAPIELDAGDPIAIFAASSFDYSLHDQTQVLAGFQIPEHYKDEAWKVHTVDPFDYMSDEIVATLLPKNVRQVEPYGGKIDYDVVGTLAGNWFMDGTGGYAGLGIDQDRYWNGHLSISYDHVDPTEIRISIGRDVGLTWEDCRVCGNVYAVKGNSPDPASVTAADGIIKYEMTGRSRVEGRPEQSTSDGVSLGTFVAQVIDDETIRVEFVRSADAASIEGFSSTSVLYRR